MPESQDLLEFAKRADTDQAIRVANSAPSSLSARDPVNGFTALHYAAFSGNMQLASFLVDRGADLYAKDFEGRWPVQLAYLTAHSKLIAYLERKTFDILSDKPEDETPPSPFNEGGPAQMPTDFGKAKNEKT